MWEHHVDPVTLMKVLMLVLIGLGFVMVGWLLVT